MAELPEFPVTWSALLLIQERIKSITSGNGYYTDLGAGIVTTDPSEVETDPAEGESPQPFTVIVGRGINENAGASGPRTFNFDMDVTIEFAVPFSASGNAELLAHFAMADIARCLRKGMQDTAIGVRSVVLTGRQLGTPADGSASVIAQVTARAGLTETYPPASS